MNRHAPADDLLDHAIRESLGGRIASSIAAAASEAWAWSSSRRLLAAAAADWRALGATQKVRMGAAAGAVAMVVNRAMAPLDPAEPFTAILPLLVLVACSLIWALASPIAREWGRLRR
jgi:hypothetical protein